MADRRGGSSAAREKAAQVPARLAEVMTRNGWNVGQMADKCGVSRSAMDKYLRGDQQPGLEALVSICLGVNVSPTWLLFGYSDDTNLSDTLVIEPVPLQALEGFILEESRLVLGQLAQQLETCASLKEVHILTAKLRQQWPDFVKARVANRVAEYYLFIDQPADRNG